MSESEASCKHFILGHPVAHSKSPAMYNAFYARLGLPWTYDFMDCPTIDQAERFVTARDFFSINITTPYKPLAFDAATVRASSATLAKGANVLVSKGDALIAYNVDGQGCIGFLERAGVDFSEASVAVCGTGPTALAILHAAALAGVAEVTLVGRDKARSRAVLEEYAATFGMLASTAIDMPAADDRHLGFGQAAEVTLVGRDKARSRAVLEEYAATFGMLASTAIDMPAADDRHLGFGQAYEHVSLKFGSYTTSTRAIASADVVIDATPLGMKKGDPAPFDVDLISSDQVIFDVVYGHGETALVSAARSAGATAFDGAGMLVAQAVATAGIVCDIAGVDMSLSFDETFSLMAEAAGFDGLAFDGAGMLVAQAVATAGIVCDIAGVDMSLSFDETFSLMAEAAGFDGLQRRSACDAALFVRRAPSSGCAFRCVSEGS